MIRHVAGDHVSQLEPCGLHEGLMRGMSGVVQEVDTGRIGVHVDQKELEVRLVPNVMAESTQGLVVGNGDGTVAESDGGGGVHRIHDHRVRELGEVVDAVAVDIGRVGDEILLHSIVVSRQRLHVLGQRGRARSASLDQDRDLHPCAVQIVLHIEDEVVRRGGRDHDGHRRDRHRRRRWVEAAFWTRLLRVALRLDRGREQRDQHYDSNRREDGGQGRRQGCEKATESPDAPRTGGGKCARAKS